MSEKIYACLLRVLPPAFRRHYEEEALQLLRDRLRDERGFSHRLRLILDLITDIARALPQAYRNSYAQVAAAAPLTSQFDGVPSFRILQKEPLRRGVIAAASVLSVTALATFAFVMGPPIPYRPAAQAGPMSPIESVIERLNQPISPSSAENGRLDAPEPASANTSRSGARALSRTSAGPSSGAKSVASAANQPGRSSESIRSARYSDQGSSVSVATPSSSTQSQSESIRKAAQNATFSNVRALSHATAAVNLSERWVGSFRAVGRDTDVPQWFILKQDGVNLTGTGGPNSTEQYPIIHGVVAGGSVTFELNEEKRRFLYKLRFEEKDLRGILSIRSTDRMRSTKVRLERIQ